MRELGQEADHLVVRLRGKHGDVAEAQDAAQGPDEFDPLRGVALRGGDDEIGAVEHAAVGPLHAGTLAAGHRMRRDELQVRAEHPLHGGDDGALDAGHVRDHGPALQTILILLHPGHEGLGVQGEDHEVELRDIFPRDVQAAVGDPTPLQGVIQGLLPAGKRTDLETQRAEFLGVRAADHAKAHDEDLPVIDESCHGCAK